MLNRRDLLTGAAAVAILSTARPVFAQGEIALVVGYPGQDVGHLDPHRATGTPDRAMVSWMFNGLVRFAPGTSNPADIEPDLAESWEHSEDGLKWTFKLRQGVQFHGTYGELKADDVVYSLQRAGDPNRSAFSGEYADITSVVAVDDYTVEINLARRVPSIFAKVVNFSGGFIVSRRAAEEMGEDFTRSPIGTGPFAFEAAPRGGAATLVKHVSYFRGEPQLDRIVYRLMPEDAARELAFRNQELDLSHMPPLQRNVDRFSQLPDTIVDSFGPGVPAILHLNQSVKPLDDIRVRKAIAHSLDRQALAAWKGLAVASPMTGIIDEDNLGFVPVDLPEHNPQLSRELLAEAGYPDGLTLSASHTSLPEMLEIMQVIQAQLQEGGITLELQIVEHATWHEIIRRDTTPVVLYLAARFPIADTYLSQFYHSAAIVNTPTAVTNFSHVSVADKDIEAAREEVDPDKQLALWAEAQRKIAAEVVGVPLISSRQTRARNNKVSYGWELKGSVASVPVIDELTSKG